MAELTPMMRQYLTIKEKNQDCILFFRLGDFYEMFDDDARLVSKELDLTLTTRDRSKENPEERTPMCGVPYHSSEAYIARLIAKGYKVAICEQLEDPALAKGLVERDIVRIVTPGTVIDSSMLEDNASNYICAVYMDDASSAICFADVSTGEICAASFTDSDSIHIANELVTRAPSEILLCRRAGDDQDLIQFLNNRMHALVQIDDRYFEHTACSEIVHRQFGADSGTNLSGMPRQSVCAVGALLSYIIETQKNSLSQINKLNLYSAGSYMELNEQTFRNLEITQTLRTSEKRGSLLWVLDKTKTPQGHRLVRSWVSHPLLSPSAINRRLDAVAELCGKTITRNELITLLRDVGDIERLIGRIAFGSANCRDLLSLASSIAVLPDIKTQMADLTAAMLRSIGDMDTLDDIAELISAAVSDDAPITLHDGGLIKPGYNSEVDRLRALLNGSTDALAAIAAREQQRTGKKLKVGYNRVSGYYIEIPRSMSEDVPQDYIRKQTLTNCERFITQELKELESELLTAKDNLAALEYRLFCELRETVGKHVTRIQATAEAVAKLDVLCSFAQVAVSNNYCRPEINIGTALNIKDGRHPVVELTQHDVMFVPNDVSLNTENLRAAIITGPNMAGKSTYMRQTALAVIMAQIGSFVPARSAEIGIVDKIFTRIGASDDLAGGMSTFMVEMSEVAAMIKGATYRSLIILDEIGRGTSTYDGMAIARAVLEFCADKKTLGAKTLFATHYHELTALEDELDGVKNYNISAKKRGNSITFLRKIVPGGTDDSYGIEVAALAGVPAGIIKRAKAVLASLEKKEPGVQDVRHDALSDDQISMESIGVNEVAETLRNTSLDTITPIEAMNLLFELKKKL